jgi:hypothetical protein
VLNSLDNFHQVNNAVAKTAGFGTKADYIQKACFVGCKFFLIVSVILCFVQPSWISKYDITVRFTDVIRKNWIYGNRMRE